MLFTPASIRCLRIFKRFPSGPSQSAFARSVRAGAIVTLYALGWASAGIASTNPRAAERWERVPLGDVRVGGEIGHRIDATIQNNLLVLNVDRDFLAPFQGDPEKRAGAYIGLGKLIDATVNFLAYTNDPKLRALKEHLVSEILRTQESDGYIGTKPPAKRVWALWDAHEISYLILGLTNDYRTFGQRDSLVGAQRLADYLIRRWQAEPLRNPSDGELADYLAVIGVESAMLALFDATSDQHYLKFCRDFRQLGTWEVSLVKGRWGNLQGHVYANIARCLAQLRLSHIDPATPQRSASQTALAFMTRQNGMVITGESGDHECWDDSQEGTVNVGETCATAYIIRWLDQLELDEGQAVYGDLIERMIYNGLFAAQSPDGRQIRYYTPFDGPRQYYSRDTFCCPNNYRRIIAELPGMIYFKTRDGIAVNLYTPSEAHIRLTPSLAVRVTQKTEYPHDDRVALQIEPEHAARFTLKLRLPKWSLKPVISVNGAPLSDHTVENGFISVSREWRPGDRIELSLPMSYRLVRGREAQAGRVAVMRGPVVLGLSRTQNTPLKNMDLRLVVLDPASVGPASVTAGSLERPAAMAKAWAPGALYPFKPTTLDLAFCEFSDPTCETIYFKVPNPSAAEFVPDELLTGTP